MKGTIFNSLADFVIETFGVAAWDTCVEKLNSSNQGIYTSFESYPDEELLSLVDIACEAFKLDKKEVVFGFGKYLFGKLIEKHPGFISEDMDLRAFLKSIEDVIHVEVKKTYQGSYLPSFDYEDHQENILVMNYHSKRKLCILAEGLIYGASERFNEKIEIHHPKCMHDGTDHCRLEVEFL